MARKNAKRRIKGTSISTRNTKKQKRRSMQKNLLSVQPNAYDIALLTGSVIFALTFIFVISDTPLTTSSGSSNLAGQAFHTQDDTSPTTKIVCMSSETNVNCASIAIDTVANSNLLTPCEAKSGCTITCDELRETCKRETTSSSVCYILNNLC